MSAFYAVYLREIRILRHKLKRQMAGMSVSPLLYMLTFGLAFAGTVEFDGRPYLEFLVPGLVAMASMTQSFAIATDINVARFYFHAFEEFQAAPVSRLAFVMGETLAGLTRALISIAIVMLLGFAFGVRIRPGFFFFLAIFLNGFAFAALAVAMAMLVKSHADQGLLSNFIITPMAFLGGTFFPLERLPGWARGILNVLPLSHASKAIRAAAFGKPPELFPFIILAGAAIIFLTLAIFSVSRARD
ncbi:MAG: ABC transporter permease [Deltaproteobacteria bacterium]|jgi:ABC-type multidrug transport system permease subunit|nr:ABC transporter permease [Deltaproteobacteria bacterium]